MSSNILLSLMDQQRSPSLRVDCLQAEFSYWTISMDRRLRQGKRRMRKRRRQAFTLSTCWHRSEQRDRTQKTSSLLLESQKERRSSSPTQRNSHAAASLSNISWFQTFICNFLRQDMLRDTDSLYFPIERFNFAIFIRILIQVGPYSALLLSQRYLHSLNSFRESSFLLRLRQQPLNSYFFFNNFSSSVPKISVNVFMESFNCSIASSIFSWERKYYAKLSYMRMMTGTFPVQKMSSSILMKARSKAQLCRWDQRSQLMAERMISQLSCVGISVTTLWQMGMFSPYAVQAWVLES